MTTQIALTLGILVLTIVLLAAEVLRIDLVALGVLLLLAWLGLIRSAEAFRGLSSGAVVSMAAVMVLGRGIDRSGLTKGLTRPVLAWAGDSERRLLTAIMAAVGSLSAFMQNIGAAALFLPAVTRIARRGGYATSRLLMPMGFAAILGGTVSMIGSGPLILLGDLLRQSGLQPFGLFAVTPYGLALLGVGIAFFALLGPRVLPTRSGAEAAETSQRELIDAWQLETALHEVSVPPGSPLIGKARDELRLKDAFHLHLVALADGTDIQPAPWRHTRFAAGQTLAVLGRQADALRFAEHFGLTAHPHPEVFADLQNPSSAGFAEVLVSPRGSVVGKSIREFGLRKTYQVEPVLLLSGGSADSADFSDRPLHAGDTLVVHGELPRLAAMGDSPDFHVVTMIDREDLDESRRWPAALCFLLALGLGLAGFPLALSLSTGALGMVLLGVLSVDTAYRAIDLRTILLVGALIPLGTAMQNTGAAAYLAQHTATLVAGTHPLVAVLVVGALATLFSLFMSNVAATVVLVPLVVKMAQPLGLDPRMLALLVAVCASNSFVLPTHQVNALLLGAGGYRNADYVRAGGAMTLLFLVTAGGTMYWFGPK
ncbi:MAG: SLC13 family permease [Planctomycetes bacterium]|nr:SLC13 family permease [Planctomycetota bacterium]MCB9870110.1 SLC13 family permease [Planctomycetota bacterium]